MGTVGVSIVAIVVAGFGLWLWAIYDALSRDWRAAGRSKGLWVATLVVLGWPAALGYLLLIRPRLAMRTALA